MPGSLSAPGIIIHEGGTTLYGKAKAYRLETFAGGLTVIEDVFQGSLILVTGHKEKNFIVPFKRTLPDGTVLSFSPSLSGSPAFEIMTDNESNAWNVFGEAVSGPRKLPCADMPYVTYEGQVYNTVMIGKHLLIFLEKMRVVNSRQSPIGMRQMK